MKKRTGCSVRCGILVLCGFLLYPTLSCAQEEETEPGHPIGKVSSKADLILMELDEGALGKANLFDLVVAPYVSPRRLPAIAWRMRPCTGIRT